jgi:hypothetical protein
MINIRDEDATMCWTMYHDCKNTGSHQLATGISIAMHELGLPKCEMCEGTGKVPRGVDPTISRGVCPVCEGKRYQSIMTGAQQ